jgi:hypothetical protein
MKKPLHVITLVIVGVTVLFSPSVAQEKKLEKIRIGGGSVGAPQMTMWFAKEAKLLCEARACHRGDLYSGELDGAAGDALRRGADHSAWRHGVDAG